MYRARSKAKSHSASRTRPRSTAWPGRNSRPRAARNRRIEGWIRYFLCAGYLFLGAESLLTGHPIAHGWLAWKALLFGAITGLVAQALLARLPPADSGGNP